MSTSPLSQLKTKTMKLWRTCFKLARKSAKMTSISSR
jgi:hypothetical protein